MRRVFFLYIWYISFVEKWAAFISPVPFLLQLSYLCGIRRLLYASFLFSSSKFPDVGFCVFAGKANVDLPKLIQLGLTFSNEDGNLPTCGTYKFCLWQFNFREFNLDDDVFANDSIELLRQSGIDFKKNSEHGVDASRFAELLMSSRIALNDAVHWVTFHNGYDFGYLLKLLTCRNLPDTQSDRLNPH